MLKELCSTHRKKGSKFMFCGLFWHREVYPNIVVVSKIRPMHGSCVVNAQKSAIVAFGKELAWPKL